jgi:hypothetical protein
MRSWALVLSVLLGCQTGGDESADDAESGESDSTSGDESGETGGEAGPWEPGTVYPSADGPNERGYLDRRGYIHSHSPYSHDACDDNPMPDGKPDPNCMVSLREAICLVAADFLMLTDHREFFSDYEFPDVLLYNPDFGDELIERGGGPVANRAGCGPMDHETMVLGGCEAATMPVGLEGHVADTPSGRSDIYGDATPEAITAYKDIGGVVLVAHTEDWTDQQLIDLPLDGFEMYNLHANLLGNFAAALSLVEKVKNDDPGLPHPDLIVFPIFWEDSVYLDRWAAVLEAGARRITTMGTDSHENTFPDQLADGERVDSFRRMMSWFSNHILVEPRGDGSWTDAELKQALRQGRLYGVFEYMGYAEGFDFHAAAGGEIVEMGGEVSISDGVELNVAIPSVQNLDPEVDAPEMTAHLYRAEGGEWVEVAMDTQDLSLEINDAGVYRAEIRIVPSHLVGYLGDYADGATEDRVWIYSNAIFVTQ